MKITKFIAASLAGLTMFSCSQEITDSALSSPTDAVITMQIGGGTTTYGTATNEKLIDNVVAGLYNKKSGAKVNLKTSSYANGKLTLTVDGANIPTDADCELAIFANVDGLTDLPATMAEAKAFPTTQVLDYNLVKGLPASSVVPVTGLAAGSTATVPAADLIRAVARFWVESGTGTRSDIVDYKVEIAQMNTGVIINTGAGIAPADKSYSYTVGATAPNEQLTVAGKVQESAFYTYPTASGAVINVYDNANTLVATTKVPVAIVSNKNYKITVSKNMNEGSASVDVTIKEFDEANEFDVVIGGKVVNTEFTSDAGVALKDGKLSIPGTGMAGVAAIKASDIIADELYAIRNVSITATKVIDESKMTASYNATDGTVLLTMPANYSGEDYTSGSTLSIEVVNKVSQEAATTLSLPITIKASDVVVPEGLFTDMYGVKWVKVAYQKDLATTVSNYNTINALEGNSFDEKLMTYKKNTQITNMNNNLLVGSKFSADKLQIPAGFKVVTAKEFYALGNVAVADPFDGVTKRDVLITAFDQPVEFGTSNRFVTLRKLDLHGNNIVYWLYKDGETGNEYSLIYNNNQSGGPKYSRLLLADKGANGKSYALIQMLAESGLPTAVSIAGASTMSSAADVADVSVRLVKDESANVIW